MSESGRVETHFSDRAETPELADYHPISPLVIVACIAALASSLATIHPVLWILPVLAVILSTCAIVQVSAAQSRYSGRRAAIIALCLATLIGGYASASALSRERALYARARSKAEQWILLVQQGHVQEAHQLTMDVNERFQGPESLASYYAGPAPRDPAMAQFASEEAMPMEQPPGDGLELFIKSDVTAKILAYGEQARIEHLQNVTIELGQGAQKITQRFRASRVYDGQPDSVEFLIHATRRVEREHASWKVGELEEVK